MPSAGGEGLEKIEDMIVRAAESTAAQVRAAKAAIGTVIFGQEKVLEQALVTILSGGHALLLGLPGLAKTKLVDTLGTVLGLDARRIQFTLDLFLMEIDVGYPDREAERRILFETTGSEETRPKPAMTAEDLMAAQRLVRRLPVGDSVVEAILALVRSARPGADGGSDAKLIA